MVQIKADARQKHDHDIDPETLEKYLHKVTDKGIKLLEEHTHLVNQLYEQGLADFNDAIHLQHANKNLCRKLRAALRSKPTSLMRQALDLALREKGAPE